MANRMCWDKPKFRTGRSDRPMAPELLCLLVTLGRRLAVWIAVLACVPIFLLAIPLYAEDGKEVLVVLSSDAKPYKDALGAMQERLEKDAHKCNSILLADLNAEKLDVLLKQKPEALVAIGSDAAVYLHDKVPEGHKLLYCLVTDPGALGLLKGRPAQGVTVDVPVKDQFALIAETLPKARTMGMLYDSKGDRSTHLLKTVRDALPAAWSLEAVDLSKFESVAKAIEEMLKRHIDIVWTAPDSDVYNQASVRVLLREALRQKIPVFGFSKSFVKAGALVGVAIEPESQGEQAAEILDRLTNPKPKAAPLKSDEQHVEAPVFAVAVNEVVAQQLSISVPESVMKKAASKGN